MTWPSTRMLALFEIRLLNAQILGAKQNSRSSRGIQVDLDDQFSNLKFHVKGFRRNR